MRALLNRVTKAARSLFASELAWRCYVVVQAIFLLAMVVFQVATFGHHLHTGPRDWTWHFYIFPEWNTDAKDRHDGSFHPLLFWGPLIYYTVVPFLVVRAVDWITSAKKHK